MATRVRSYSKINLGLAIGPPREDGFHALRTLYQTVALHDVLEVSAISREAVHRLIRLHSSECCGGSPEIHGYIKLHPVQFDRPVEASNHLMPAK